MRWGVIIALWLVLLLIGKPLGLNINMSTGMLLSCVMVSGALLLGEIYGIVHSIYKSRKVPIQVEWKSIRPTVVLFTIAVLAFFGMQSIRFNMIESAKQDVMNVITDQSKAPDGVFEFKWLMTKKEVQNICNTCIEQDGTFVRTDRLFQRPIMLNLMFKDDRLTQIVCYFTDTINANEDKALYQNTHKQVISQYGDMSEPRSEGDAILTSNKKVGSIAIYHSINKIGSYTPERLMLFMSNE